MFLQICDVTIASILSALSLLKGIQEEINYKVTAKTSVSPRSSLLGTFHVPSGEERGETDVFAG